ncbi:uncharacterized protein LOC112592735, partial [Melanaphis sacchari]|uniref:uncharacterized protein LOC112592735 n=1 Tax=Melanaphis sacchari TaxID=742174 RepID=UPI000DC14220
MAIISRVVHPYHRSMMICQCHLGTEFTLKSNVRTVLANREAALRTMEGVKFFHGFGVYDHGYFTARGVKQPHQKLLPNCRYEQAYNPAVHMLRRGLNENSILTWLSFSRDSVLGSDVRVECVVSADNCGQVLALMPTYGTRMAELFLSEGLLVRSNKTWPFYINDTIINYLNRIVNNIEILSTCHFHNRGSLLSLLTTIYDQEIVLRFFAFGEARFLDSKRVAAIFPTRQVIPGHRRKTRRDENGFVRFAPSECGIFNQILPKKIFGRNVPVGPF